MYFNVKVMALLIPKSQELVSVQYSVYELQLYIQFDTTQVLNGSPQRVLKLSAQVRKIL